MIGASGHCPRLTDIRLLTSAATEVAAEVTRRTVDEAKHAEIRLLTSAATGVAAEVTRRIVDEAKHSDIRLLTSAATQARVAAQQIGGSVQMPPDGDRR